VMPDRYRGFKIADRFLSRRQSRIGYRFVATPNLPTPLPEIYRLTIIQNRANRREAASRGAESRPWASAPDATGAAPAAARIAHTTQLLALVTPAFESVLMIIDIGSVEALCALPDWNVEKSALSAWLALLLELLLDVAAVEAVLALELEPLVEEAWW